jgi:hypothetical protein
VAFGESPAAPRRTQDEPRQGESGTLLVALPDLVAGHMAEHDRRDGAKQPEAEKLYDPANERRDGETVRFPAT